MVKSWSKRTLRLRCGTGGGVDLVHGKASDKGKTRVAPRLHMIGSSRGGRGTKPGLEWVSWVSGRAGEWAGVPGSIVGSLALRFSVLVSDLLSHLTCLQHAAHLISGGHRGLRQPLVQTQKGGGCDLESPASRHGSNGRRFV